MLASFERMKPDARGRGLFHEGIRDLGVGSGPRWRSSASGGSHRPGCLAAIRHWYEGRIDACRWRAHPFALACGAAMASRVVSQSRLNAGGPRHRRSRRKWRCTVRRA